MLIFAVAVSVVIQSPNISQECFDVVLKSNLSFASEADERLWEAAQCGNLIVASYLAQKLFQYVLPFLPHYY